MSTNIEIDQMLRRAMKLLHSSQPNSVTDIRELLDDMIKQRYGPEKTLGNTLNRRYLDEERNFPGRAPTPPPQLQQTHQEQEIINLTHSPAKTISDSPDTIMDSEEGGTGGTTAVVGASLQSIVEDDGNLKDFGDLNCCVCGEIMFTATNRLIECSKCGTLYHQECHKPPITDEEASEGQEHNWQCDSCACKPSTSKTPSAIAPSALIPEEPISLISKTKSSNNSHSSSSSNSSSPYYKPEQPAVVLPAAGPPATASVSSSSGTTKPHKDERSSSRLHAKRSSHSSSKSSKYHESSNSKRKSK